MLVPVSISRLTSVLKEKNNSFLISTTFIATFPGGNQKMLNSQKWQSKGLLRDHELNSEVVLSRNECTLYFRDWSKVPMRGDFSKHYPSVSIIPSELIELL